MISGMSDEKIIVSSAGQVDLTRSYSRNQFYDEQFSGSDKSDLAVHTVAVFMITSGGEILLQKRSSAKRHNPRLIDKTMGGHITFGDDPDYTVMVETVQELLTPSIVVKTEQDFMKAYALLKDYLNTVALVKRIGVREIKLTKVSNGRNYKVNNVIHCYIGIYDGSTKPADKESAGMLYYNIDSIEEEFQANPEQFTDDLKVLLPMYKEQLRNITL